jgi:hypothetical protein
VVGLPSAPRPVPLLSPLALALLMLSIAACAWFAGSRRRA